MRKIPTNIKLYKWQKECINKWFSSDCRGIAQVATGGGKTFMAIYSAIMLLNNRSNLKIKIIVPKTFLVQQWKTCLINDFCINKDEIGCFYGKEKCYDSKLFMIYVINSARYTFSKTILDEQNEGNSHLLILDECHHYSSPENSKIFEFLTNKKYDTKQYFSLGLSATPKTITSSYTTEKTIGPIFYNYSISKAMKDNIINECVIYNIKLSFTEEEALEYDVVSKQISRLISILYSKFPELKKTKMNLDQFITSLKKIIRTEDEELGGMALSILQKLRERQDILYNANSRLLAVINLIDLLFDTKKIIIFTERIIQVDALYFRLNKKYKGKIAKYHSNMEEWEKQSALESYRIGSSKILLTCKALDEGLNIPSSDIGIILSGNAQERQRIQRLGRILRKVKGKSQSSLFYCYLGDTVEKNKLLNESFVDKKEFNLIFNNITGEISFPYYAKLSQIILNEIKLKDENLVTLFSKYLNEGMFNNDWLESIEHIEKNIRNSNNLNRKNYWFCMKKVQLLRKNLTDY
ncbi:MAG: DEAD/DEAH box helicase [Pleomorphochaeta sp.]